ncbi:MAG: hypothetical protein PHT60_14840 [Acidiphilium sp.]|nr:hypothetical protein [Acidiphilium sp.]MDD4937038.1 hypothetical protein [Acidiphilium sp.]
MLAERILEDRSSSYWLTEALRTALLRDPVDAVFDAELLFKALDERLDVLLAVGRGGDRDGE